MFVSNSLRGWLVTFAHLPWLQRCCNYQIWMARFLWVVPGMGSECCLLWWKGEMCLRSVSCADQRSSQSRVCLVLRVIWGLSQCLPTLKGVLVTETKIKWERRWQRMNTACGYSLNKQPIRPLHAYVLLVCLSASQALCFDSWKIDGFTVVCR